MSRGGFRQGAGRKKNSGPFREGTVVRRIPASIAATLDLYFDSFKSTGSGSESALCFEDIFEIEKNNIKLPLFSNSVSAGFPSPAEADVETYLDLNSYLIPKPVTTFFVRVTGESMVGVGIHQDDILIVDKSLQAKDGDIVIAVVNGELTVKRLSLKGEACFLLPENPDYLPIKVTEEMDFSIWGVVTSVVHQFK